MNNTHESTPPDAAAAVPPTLPPAGKTVPDSAPEPGIVWVEADANPWGVPILDMRSFTQSMMSTSADPRCATNAVSYGNDDGEAFAGQLPNDRESVPADLTFPIDGLLADGVLFTPMQMEHKWAIFYRDNKIICVRSWQREVYVVAHTEQDGKFLTVRKIDGSFGQMSDDENLTAKTLDYLLRSHVLGQDYPVPIPAELAQNPQLAAQWCFSTFGNQAQCATPHDFARVPPTMPLRSHSLLHIAVAKADMDKINQALGAGIPVDLLAGDGLAPLHWALVQPDSAIMSLLLAKGASVDVQSHQGATPLMNAVQGDNLAAVLFLLEHGAEPNARDFRGFTALHRAAEMGKLDIARVLLERGASPVAEAQGHTPRSLAQQRELPEMIALLAG
ncbi:ankyrin repeat domain-containing protein [Massilia sp. CF038]|uniref:ankyrin repeat domain-containing protein n=1 Tax=Massilia sp. CF038 TaxID=1881045 RepID=UPI000935139D|nr:ankyrin repeat domain-containing protein [Massilia sp. CF038]